MNHIHGFQLKQHGPGVVTRDRNVNFVGSHHAVIRIAYFPPPLVTHYGDVLGGLRQPGVLQRKMNRAVTPMSTNTPGIGMKVQAISIWLLP